MTATFKSSAFLAGIAVKVDKNGDHFLAKLGQEHSFFDATHGRVKDHVTFELHVYTILCFANSYGSQRWNARVRRRKP